MSRLFLIGVRKNDLDLEGYNTIGYILGLWNGQSNYNSSFVSFTLAASSLKISNNCLIKFPAEGPVKESLLQLTKVCRISDLLIKNFDPDILVLNSRRLQTELDTANEIGWVTYKKQVNKRVKVSQNKYMIQITKEGIFFI